MHGVDSNDERKTRVDLTFGSRNTLMSKVPRDCWNCRVFHSTLSRVPLDSRTELIQVTRKIDSVLMRTVELRQLWFLLRWR